MLIFYLLKFPLLNLQRIATLRVAFNNIPAELAYNTDNRKIGINLNRKRHLDTPEDLS